jgi:hypothetical protein
VGEWLEDSAGPPWAAQVQLHHLPVATTLSAHIEGCRDEVVVYQNDEIILRRSMTEIKTYEEVYTGKIVSCLQQ